MRCSPITLRRRARRSWRRSPATSAAAPATPRSWERSRSPPERRRPPARRQPAGRTMTAPRFRYVSSDRRVREDRRFVAGKGRFVADIALPGARHVALVTCPHPAARSVAIDKRAALAMPGVHYVLDGAELAAATLPLMAGLDTPNVPPRAA